MPGEKEKSLKLMSITLIAVIILALILFITGFNSIIYSVKIFYWWGKTGLYALLAYELSLNILLMVIIILLYKYRDKFSQNISKQSRLKKFVTYLGIFMLVMAVFLNGEDLKHIAQDLKEGPLTQQVVVTKINSYSTGSRHKVRHVKLEAITETNKRLTLNISPLESFRTDECQSLMDKFVSHGQKPLLVKLTYYPHTPVVEKIGQ